MTSALRRAREPAPRHRRRLRRRCRRRRRGHRAAVRRAHRRAPTPSAAGSPATSRALLVDESHVAAVADPAGGSYAVEQLTDDLAGPPGPSSAGSRPTGEDGFDDRVADVRRARREAASPPAPAAHRAQRVPQPRPTRCPARRQPSSYRYGAAFEALRADPPAAHVFLATLGPVAAAHRAGQVRHQPAGRRRHRRRRRRGDHRVSTTSSRPTTARRVVCLAGTDAAYAEWGSEAAAALRDAGAAAA